MNCRSLLLVTAYQTAASLRYTTHRLASEYEMERTERSLRHRRRT
jgi:hypothetical protein